MLIVRAERCSARGNPIWQPLCFLDRVQQCVTYLAIHAFTLATNFPREVAEETILEKYEEGKFHPPTLMTTFGVEHGRTDEWGGSARHKGGPRRGTFGEYAEKRRGQRARHVCGMCEACTMQHARGRNPMHKHPGAKKT